MKLMIAAKVDNADKKYYEREIKPLIDASPWVEFIGEINDRAETRVPVWCSWPAVPDRLAGAVRPGDDREHGLRHAGDRLQPRLGARGDRRRRVRLHRPRRGQRHCRGRPAGRAGSRHRACSHTFDRRFTARRMAEDYLDLYEGAVRAAASVAARGRGLTASATDGYHTGRAIGCPARSVLAPRRGYGPDHDTAAQPGRIERPQLLRRRHPDGIRTVLHRLSHPEGVEIRSISASHSASARQRP